VQNSKICSKVRRLKTRLFLRAKIGRKMGDTPPRRASVHLRLDSGTLAFYRAAGRGHLTRMANILKAYAETKAQLKR
jgi:uncharacterized protein (DUF4415 family)